jgi:hypothetical protein
LKILIVGGVSPTRRRCVIAARHLHLDVHLATDARNVPWPSAREAPQMAACIVRSSNETTKQAEMLVRARFPSIPILTLFENEAPYFTRDPESAILTRMGSVRISLTSIKRMLSELSPAVRTVRSDRVCVKEEGTLQKE